MLSNLPNAKWIIWEKFRGHLCAWISACKEWQATTPLSKSHCDLVNNYLAPGTNACSSGCGCLHLSWNSVLSCKMGFLLQPEHIQWKEFNITSMGRWFHCWKTVTIGSWSKIDSDLPSFNWNPLICILYFGTAAGVATIRTKKSLVHIVHNMTPLQLFEDCFYLFQLSFLKAFDFFFQNEKHIYPLLFSIFSLYL